jgi:signal transduction histidine kinase
VRFDDRLKTVLAQPAASAHDIAVRWRQLVELAARAPPDGDRSLLDEAIRQIRDGTSSVDERVRSAAALAVAPLPLPAALVSAFAADRLNVAAPILAGARLTASEWMDVAAAASDDCRAFISTMRMDHPPRAAAAPAPAPAADQSAHIPSISEVVARIERLRQSREAAPSEESAESAEAPRLFRWECNEAGEIEWVEGAPRGALVGQSIAQRAPAGGVDRTVERAFASRAPFHDGILELPRDSAIGGSWKIGGIPAFDRVNGRFAGYRGVAERLDHGAAASAAGAADPDALRELAHEIKTPLNAIIGFAEIITGEYLGPAGTVHRERAAEIVAQARLLLNAIEDLDFAARLRSTKGADSARTDLGKLVDRVVGSLNESASERGVRIDGARTHGGIVAAIQPEVAERLMLRMCDAIVARAEDGEHLQVMLDCDGAHCIASISRPRALHGAPDEELFGNADDAMSAAFPLRLARGLAQTAGTALIASEDRISLLFPRA